MKRATFVLDEVAFRQNLSLIAELATAAQIEVILALKAFSFWPAFPIVSEYLSGATASSLNEAKLVAKHLGVAPHVYSPAYLPNEVEELLALSGPITFNSLTELERYRPNWRRAMASVGVRVNPLYSPVEIALYNPASPTGRLGVPIDQLPPKPPVGVQGVHVHTLCESTAEQSAHLLDVLTDRLAAWLPHLSWVNLGGGHLMTKAGYDAELLVESLKTFRAKYPHLQLILEPGSAHAWNAGFLVAHVLDIVDHGGRKTALLDVSFTCHMPDTLEMPYRPSIRDAQDLGAAARQTATTYDLGGISCLAGDFIAGYEFAAPLAVGDEVVFEDMLHYTTVKTTTFNGVQHPDLAIARVDGALEVVRQFGFSDFESRLG